jgi:hypothetical protein
MTNQLRMISIKETVMASFLQRGSRDTAAGDLSSKPSAPSIEPSKICEHDAAQSKFLKYFVEQPGAALFQREK